MKIDSKKLARRIAKVAQDKKAQGLVVLDMRRVCNFCDYFVILNATSYRHSRAVSEEIEKDLSRDGIKSFQSSISTEESDWNLLDYNSVIVHIFSEWGREFYALERLWQDATRLRLRLTSRRQ
jgi:ribosome-associated protein